MVWIPGGTFQMGSNEHYPEEAPAHPVRVDGFWIDRAQVTNAQFRRFIKASGYITVAERAASTADYPGARPEMLAPGSIIFRPTPGPVPLGHHERWWAWVAGANWRRPEGPSSSLDGRDRHPVVHVAWEDVVAYAAWAGKSLPTEAEWEFAARGGLEGKAYAWGDELAPKGRMLAHFWQGSFPWQNLALDGFERTAPVGAFPPNGYGLVDMIGNVWEWTRDWYRAGHEARSPCCGAQVNPRNDDRAGSFDPASRTLPIPRKVLKGGSFACAENYCQRFRPAARMPHAIDTSTNHIGFRCVVRPDEPGEPA
jgi:formylglycine-generating enzyme required for sulfatase activity